MKHQTSSLEQIVECVPNFSEGRDNNKISAIIEEIRKIKGVKLMHVDIGYDANRTVVTFAGNPDAVKEAVFKACKKAVELIDMRAHKGVHPRIGAIDVMPFIPLREITMDETVVLAHNIAELLGNELGIHIYCYEYAALKKERFNLASCRAGEYEGLEKKLSDREWKPDFGPVEFNPKTGATIVGARNVLVAYNVNLNTGNVAIAKKIAGIIRESGYIEYFINSEGEKIKIRKPGKFKGLKALGWYMHQYHRVQISTNITNINTAPIHLVFEEIKAIAGNFGVEVTGSEIIGMVPLKTLADAGDYYLNLTGKPIIDIDSSIDSAVHFLGLNDVQVFDKSKRVIEYVLSENFNK